MSEAPEPVVNVEAVVDPMVQIEYWQLRHQHWRRLALWTFAALGVILVLSGVQFVATWMALSKLIPAQQEVGGMKTDVGNLIQETRADLIHMERATQQDLATTIAQAKLEAKQEVTAELVQFKKDVNEALTQAQDLLRAPQFKYVLTEVGRIDFQLERLKELTDRLKGQEKEFQKIAQAYQGANFTEAIRRDVEQQMLQAKQTLETVRNEMKALLEEVKLQRGLLDKTKAANPFVVPKKD